jgi:aminopeptidase
MSDPRVARLAQVLVGYSTAIQPGDWVLVSANLAALPLVEEVSRQVLALGGKLSLQFESDELTEILLQEASEDVLRWLSPAEQLLFEQVNAIIYLGGASNTRALSSASPARVSAYQKERGRLRQVRNRRVVADGLRWVYTQFPCPALAQEAGVGLYAYQDFVYAATYCSQADPLLKWQETSQRQQHWVDWLKDRRQVEISGPSIDLKCSIAGRTFINAAGKNNIPDGEIFIGPVEDSVDGWVRFSYPAIFNGRSVEGVELHFEAGKVVSARAEKDETYLLAMLDSDVGARRLGEFAIGTNYAIQQFTRNILYDEKIGGTIHLALGNGYPETGSLNHSTIHWDMICDMRQGSEIRVDGELFYRDGEFQI